jgi:Flp pilus assembly protein TadD
LDLAPTDGRLASCSANLRATLGQPAEAVDLIHQALATDPLRAGWYWGLSGNLVALNRLDEADKAIRRAIELQPKAVSYNLQLATIEIQRGNAQAALAPQNGNRRGCGRTRRSRWRARSGPTGRQPMLRSRS